METMIIHYSPGPCKYDAKAFQSLDNNETIRIGIDSKLKCSAGRDEFGIQLDIKVLIGEKEILNIGLLFALHGDGFGQILIDDPTLREHKLVLENICCQVWTAAIGAVAASTTEIAKSMKDSDQTIVTGFILPPIDSKELANDIIIVDRSTNL